MMIKKPLKFKPILKEKIWGGTKLVKLLNKECVSNKIGESWEISDVNSDISEVINGKYKGKSLTNLINRFKGELVGEHIYKHFGNKFPLLIKYIDARESLSIQLHPDDELAIKKHNSFGKTELWYVMQADKKSKLIVGFDKEVDKNEYQKHLKEKTLMNILNVDFVNEGDVYFIPSGRVHSIGAGVLLAEIQQASDITYRIYDWDRQDDNGGFRELHTDNALDAIDYKVYNSYRKAYKLETNKSSEIVSCPFFITNIIEIDHELKVDHSKKDSFVIYMCVSGNVTFVNNYFEIELSYGETLMIPNKLKKFRIIANKTSKLLEVYINLKK